MFTCGAGLGGETYLFGMGDPYELSLEFERNGLFALLLLLSWVWMALLRGVPMGLP